MLTQDDHPLLDLAAFTAEWPDALAALPAPPWLDALADPAAATPFAPPDDDHTARVRALLRHGGFKPSGRSKPCNEYIRAAAGRGEFPRINPVVDLTNAAALHGALPVSTVDLHRLEVPLSVAVAPPGARYVFNASGQEIDLAGLLCLFDARGPAANAVKDAQRAKTDGATRATLTLIWGTRALPGRAASLARWMIERAESMGAAVRLVTEEARP